MLLEVLTKRYRKFNYDSRFRRY